MDVYKIRDLMRSGVAIQQIPLRVTYYARVSTEREEQASSLENQITYYQSYIKSNSMWTFVDGYVDEGISGASTKKRDSFNRMIKDGKYGRFDFIITKEISRFSRNTVDSIQFTQQLLQYNVGVLFQNDNINTFDTDGELRLTIMSSLAQDELRRLSERVKFGHKQCIKNGKVLGNDKLYGYNKKNCILTINEEQAEVVRLIFDLYANQQLGMRAISKILFDRGITSGKGNLFNTRTMANMLNNPKYKGYYRGNITTSIDYRTKKSIFLPESEWILYKDKSIPAIVSEELWDKAHALLQSRSEHFKDSGARTHNRYAYSGKIACAEHGTSFLRALRESGKEVWQCRVYNERGAKACTAPTIYTSELDEIMADIFKDMQKDKNIIIDDIIKLIKNSPDRKNYEHNMEIIKDEITVLNSKKEKRLELSIDGAINNLEFKKRNDALNEQIAQAQSNLSTLSGEKSKSQKVESDTDEIRRVLVRELSLENSINSELVTSILEKITVYNTGDKLHVKLKIHLAVGDVLEREYDRSSLSVCSNKPSGTTPTSGIRRTCSR
ncbi:MAG: recombinase family protein [Oscillospiraceae bacterium]|nr:recombinase family protein [Oscillospiraceae bacterium]